MGEVYLARDTTLGRLVALKFLPPHLSEEADARLRFTQEAVAASALKHANVATIYEIGRGEDGTPFMAMEYCEGETLRQKLARGPLPVPDAVDYATQVACGLRHAHEAHVTGPDGVARHGVVHRDIKPANLIVTPEGVVKILDFGLAKVDDLTLTQTGATLGTALYMSPEQARGETVDARTDLWAVGVVLYEMLTGRPPFGGGYEQAVLYAIAHEAPAPLPENVPESVAGVVARCLEKDPAARYPSARDLVADLEEIKQDAVSGTSAARWPKRRRVGPRRSLLAFPLAFIVVAALAGVAFWVLREPNVSGKQVLAVLPFKSIGATEEHEMVTVGLHEVLTSRLTQLGWSQDAISFVPASEVSSDMSPDEVRTRFKATLVATGVVQFEGDVARLTLNLLDLATGTQRGSRNIDQQGGTTFALQDTAFTTLASLLEVQLQPAERTLLTEGGTTNPKANTFYLAGRGYLKQNTEPQMVRSLSMFEAALEEDPDFVLAEAGMGEAYWKRYTITKVPEWAERAIAHVERALQRNDRLAQVHAALGYIYDGQGLYAEAVEAYTRALDIEPRAAQYYKRRAITYRRMGEATLAEADYQQALLLDPNDWGGHYHYAIFLQYAGRYPEALASYKRAQALAPDNASIVNAMGALYWHTLQLDAAREAFEQSLALDSTNQTATGNLAVLYFYQRRYTDAVPLFRRALGWTPQNHEMLAALAHTHYRMPEHHAQAIDEYQQAIVLARENLRVTPYDPDLLGGLATYYAHTSQPDSALIYLDKLERALPSDLQDGEHPFGMGEVYAQLGRREQALAWLERGLALGGVWDRARYSPWLDTLRGEPAFERLLTRYPPPDFGF